MNKKPKTEPTAKILTRIYIQHDGNVVITDLWEEILEILGEVKKPTEEHKNAVG